MIHKKEPSPQAKKLYEALQAKGINAVSQYWDGFKHVDIAILPAHLYIEVDGLQHFTNHEQIIRDFKRYHYSDGDDFSTFCVTNQIIDKYLDRVVSALVLVVEQRIK